MYSSYGWHQLFWLFMADASDKGQLQSHSGYLILYPYVKHHISSHSAGILSNHTDGMHQGKETENCDPSLLQKGQKNKWDGRPRFLATSLPVPIHFDLPAPGVGEELNSYRSSRPFSLSLLFSFKGRGRRKARTLCVFHSSLCCWQPAR